MVAGYLPSHKLPSVFYLLHCIPLSVSLTVWPCAQVSARINGSKHSGTGEISVQKAQIKCVSLSPTKNIISLFTQGLLVSSAPPLRVNSIDIMSKGSFRLFDSPSANKEPRSLHHHTSEFFDNDRALMRLKTRPGSC